MEVFMKKMRISRDSKKLGEKKVPLLIGDDSGKDMPYTESATLRTHQLKIRNFLKLTDYMIIHAKTELTINMISNLERNLAEINDLASSEGKGFHSMSWILVELYQEEGTLKFDPPKERFKQ